MLYSPAANRTADTEARISHLFIKPEHGALMDPRSAVRAVEGAGLEGDAAFGTSRRQVLLIDAETLSRFGLAPGSVRENITTVGLPMAGLGPGTHLHINDVVLEITGECTGCGYLDTLRPGLRADLEGRRGLLARVTRGGTLTVGTLVRVDDSDIDAEGTPSS